MQFYDLDKLKVKKRNFLAVFILALIPLISLAGYQLFSMIIELAGAVKDGDIIAGLLAFILKIFVGSIILIIISVIWTALCCYLPLKKLRDYYCRNIFTRAVLSNSDYTYVNYTEQLLNTEELVEAKIIHPYTDNKQKEAEYLTGRYREIDFEAAPLTLSYGKRANEEIDGSIAVFTGLTELFKEEDFVQISCSTDEDVFAEYLPAMRGLKVKKRITAENGRKCVITAPEKQLISEEQSALLEQLALNISEQVITYFYIIFTRGRVYFINDDSSVIIKLPLWRSIEKEIAEVEKNGIANINMFVNTFISVTAFKGKG